MEQGKPLNGLGSRFEVGGAQAWTHYTADLDIPVKILQDNNEGRIELHRKSIGVVGSITPWNWPRRVSGHIIPAIRAGNTVVNKPSPFTPLSTLRMIAPTQATCDPASSIAWPGRISLVPACRIIRASARSLLPDPPRLEPRSCHLRRGRKRLTLELGGNDAAIVLPDVDAQQIAEGLFWGAFINNGQTCAALKRLYVHDDIYDDVCDSLAAYARNVTVGDGFDENSVLGPIQNRMQRDKVVGLVQAAKSAGGRAPVGGEANGDGLFFPPTLVADLDNGNPLVDEEQFGPVLPIIRYADLNEVIARANHNPNWTVAPYGRKTSGAPRKSRLNSNAARFGSTSTAPFSPTRRSAAQKVLDLAWSSARKGCLKIRS